MLNGSVGYTTFVARTFPVASTIASLHPFLNPGSHPSTTFPAIGGCKRSCSRFLPNTLIAPSSAVSVRVFLISLSMAGAISLSYASAIHSLRYGVVYSLSFVIICFSRYLSILSSGASTLIVRNFSFSPLFIARILCPGIDAIASL